MLDLGSRQLTQPLDYYTYNCPTHHRCASDFARIVTVAGALQLECAHLAHIPTTIEEAESGP
jgi:hypothetical protein